MSFDATALQYISACLKPKCPICLNDFPKGEYIPQVKTSGMNTQFSEYTKSMIKYICSNCGIVYSRNIEALENIGFSFKNQ